MTGSKPARPQHAPSVSTVFRNAICEGPSRLQSSPDAVGLDGGELCPSSLLLFPFAVRRVRAVAARHVTRAAVLAALIAMSPVGDELESALPLCWWFV